MKAKSLFIVLAGILVIACATVHPNDYLNWMSDSAEYSTAHPYWRNSQLIAAITLFILALLATVYQLRVQRTHNEKSLKPLGQIDLIDQQDQISVRVSNNGVGPMIVDRLSFSKDGKLYATIEECLELDRRFYARLDSSESVRKVILPNASLLIFETRIDEHEGEAAMDRARNELSPITLKVEGRDIYDNKMTIARDFQWFARHSPMVVKT